MSDDAVLLLEEDRLTAELLRTVLEQGGCRVEWAPRFSEGLAALARGAFGLVFADATTGQGGVIALLRRIRAASPQSAVVALTSDARPEGAEEALQAGALDVLVKPFRVEAVRRALHRYRDPGARPATDDAPWIAADRHMLRICEAGRLAACADAPVLISGESGVGKDALARWIHREGPRAGRPFVRLSCGAPVSDAASDSGREPPSAAFDRVQDGTLLLADADEASPALQAAVAAWMEETFGPREAEPALPRVIATARGDLRRAAREGGFRSDLFFRLNVIPIVVPPLRDRAGDIPPLVRHYLGRAARIEGREPPRVTEEALRRLMRYSWPGNVRELKNLMRRLIILHAGDPLDVQDLPPEVAAPDAGASEGIAVGQSLECAERWLIVKTLQHTHGNRTEAARLLGITTRTLRNKLALYRAQGLFEGRRVLEADAEDFSLPTLHLSSSA